MMRSGEHALWDARMATNPVRAELHARAAQLAALVEPIRHAMAALGSAMEGTAKRFAELVQAFDAPRP
jgi:hypothetical protein